MTHGKVARRLLIYKADKEKGGNGAMDQETIIGLIQSEMKPGMGCGTGRDWSCCVQYMRQTKFAGSGDTSEAEFQYF